MRTTLITAALALSLGALASHAQIGSQPGSGFTTVLSSGMRYTMNYEQRFALLAADEQYVPDKMEEYYKAYSALDDILATATYTNVRRILKSDLERE